MIYFFCLIFNFCCYNIKIFIDCFFFVFFLKKLLQFKPFIFQYSIIKKYIIKKVIDKETKEFKHENFFKQIGFTKGDSYYSLKRIEKRFDNICS